MKFEPTEAQRNAVEITDQSIVLSAGAGSGKTRVLVQRYLHLLEKRLAGVDEILAITFTNKAAGEMKERILQEVFKQVIQAHNPDEKEFWQNVKEELNMAHITTFHGFCGQILRTNPIEVGIDPLFRVLDEEEADELLESVIEELLLDSLEQFEVNMVTLVREYGLYAINGLLKSAYLSSRDSHLSLLELTELSVERLSKTKEVIEDLKQEVIDLLEEMIEINKTSKLSVGTQQKLNLLEENWTDYVKQIRGIQKITDQEREVFHQIRGILSGNLARGVKEQNSRFKEIYENQELDQCLADLRAMELIPALKSVLETIDIEYKRAKQRLGGLDFSDLERGAIRILKENPDFTDELGASYKFLMVDEFQDTNPVQEELIRLLLGCNSSAELCGYKLFIVGDPKQSIYRFRRADVTVFKKFQQEIKGIGREILMNKNFRSRKKIIDFVNHFFAQVFGAEDNTYDMDYQASEAFRECSDQDISVELLILDDDELKSAELSKREVEASQLAQRIQEMVFGQERLVYEKINGESEEARPVRYCDICILLQALSNVEIYEEALQRANIPYTVVNGRGFFERQEIRDLINVLKVVDNPSLKIQWTGVLRSPFCGLSDEEVFEVFTSDYEVMEVVANPELVSGLSEVAFQGLQSFNQAYQDARVTQEKIEISALISKFLEKTGYMTLMLAHPYGDLLRANIEKLIAKAREYEQDVHSTLVGFIRYVEKLDAKGVREGLAQIPGQNDVVKLMSIHQAKGLEFPVVILPDTQRPLINYSMVPDIYFDFELGIGLKVSDPITGGKVKTSLHNQIFELEKKREIAERKRLFYVAATRARDYLLISGTLKKFKTLEINDGKSWLEWLGLVFGFSSMEDVGTSYEYGPENQHKLCVRLCSDEKNRYPVAVRREDISLATWEDTYHTFTQQVANVKYLKHQLLSDFYSFGVTELMTYQSCPRWYYHRFIQRMPSNIATPELSLQLLNMDDLSKVLWKDEILHTTQPGLMAADERGTLIHFICQHIHTIDELGELVQRGIYQMGLEYRLTLVNWVQVEAEVRPYIETFLLREHELIALGMNDQREFAFDLILEEFRISGIIDRVIWNSDEAIVIDYKSNKLSKSQIRQSVDRYQLQAEIYALAVHYLLGVSTVLFKFHFLILDEYEEIRFTEDTFIQIEKKVIQLKREIIAGMEQGAEGKMEEYFHCSHLPENCPYHHQYCSYLNLCQQSYKIK